MSEESRRTGHFLKVLESFGAKTGQIVRVKTKDGFEATGLLLPRYADADDEHIVLKLHSGYNIGIDVGEILSLKVLKEDNEQKTSIQKAQSPEHRESPSFLPKVLLLSTGGTIASKIDYRTGAVYPALSAADLYSALPELGEVANVKPEVVFSILSENMDMKHWQTLAERILKSSQDQTMDGFVVLAGTDILGYMAAALSFSLIGLDSPVVCVGAQRSSDRPSSDSSLNLIAAVRFAALSKRAGVYVAMHYNENDRIIAFHRGTRVRKNHTSRRDAFESIDVKPLALVEGNEMNLHGGTDDTSPKDISSFERKTKFDPDVALVKFHPGFEPTVLEYLVKEKGIKGIIIEGTGLGHVSSSTASVIPKLVQDGTFVGMTSQCIWGHTNLYVYRTGRDLLQGGVVALGNMLGETALAKLSWAIGNFDSNSVSRIMQTNLIGEMSERLVLASSNG